MEILLILSVFACVWLGVLGAGMALAPPSRADERLSAVGAIEVEMNPGTVPGAIHIASDDKSWQERLRNELWKAGLGLRPNDFIIVSVVSVVLLGGFCYLVSGNPLIGLMGIALGAACPVGFVKQRQRMRRAHFENQLPDALTLASSSLRSGFSFLQSLQMVAEQEPAPISEDVQRVLEEVSVGFTTEEALQGLARRMSSYEVDLLVTAVQIQYQVGGNLAELLDSIAETIRERYRAKREISALTAEGRLSGIILFSMPIVLLIGLVIINPTYMQTLFSHPIGQLMLLIAFGMQCLGGLTIRKMLSIDV